MSQFEDFVNLELPHRPVLLTQEITSYQGDPNNGGAPAVVQNSPKGTFYLNNLDASLWRKSTASPGSWQVISGAAIQKDETTGPINYYVNSATGSDSNSGLSSGAAFASIQRAIELMPRVIRHLVTISVAAGHYTGFSFNGRTFDAVTGDSSLAAVSIIGTYVNATVATGSATGTLTSTTTGSTVAPVSRTILGSTGNNLTVNNVKGKLLKMTSGADAGAVFPIAANDAHTITVCSHQALGAIGDTYVIQDWGTIVDTAIKAGGFFVDSTSEFENAGSAGTLVAGLSVTTNQFGYFQGLVVEGIRFDANASQADIFPYAGWFADNAGIFGLNRCFMAAGLYSGVYALSSGFRASACVFDSNNPDPTQNWSPIILDSYGGTGVCQLANCLLISSTGRNPGPALYMQPLSGGTMQLDECCIDNYVIGVKIIGGAGITVQLTATTMLLTGSQGVLSSNNSNHNNTSSTYLFMNGVDIQGASSALQLDDSTKTHCIGVTGSTNTIGFQLESGARVKCDPTTTVSGSITQISMDGVNTTLAAMRAANPKVLSNTFGTTIYEGS